MRGYLSRMVDDNDRRQLVVALTDRGRAAAEIQARARDRVDAELVARVGEDDVRAARRSLGVLIDLQQTDAAAAA